VTPDARPAFGKGVKLRRESDGTAMLLVPEGALMLNASAAATLELLDGKRSVDEIVAAVVERFEVERELARTDVCELIDRLAVRGFVVAVP
jgi:coenzyme PQQ biosynthesis protein PqqD